MKPSWSNHGLFYHFLKEHVWDVHQEIYHYKYAISVFQAIVDPTDQALKDVDYLKQLPPHICW